jgi:flagellin
MNSINTNVGALLAQKFLRSVSAELVVTQNRLSSGLRVSSVTDDASTFAVASGMRGDIKAYTAVAAALQGSVAAANVAVAAGETISTRLGDIEAKIVQLSSNALSQSERDTYNADLASLVAEVNTYLLQATYNGNNLLGVGGADMQVVANVDGSTLTLRDNNVADLAVGPINNNGQAVQGLKLVEDFRLVLDAALANLGADLARAASQAEFIRRTEETVRIGLGALVDADIALESARFNSLQARQQLAVQALGIANQAPKVLLGLFQSS